MAKSGNGEGPAFRMVPLAAEGAPFRSMEEYFSIFLVAVNMPTGALAMSRFAPVVWASVKYPSFDGEKTLIGLFPSRQESRPDFARGDRVHVIDMELTPRIIAAEQITLEFTLGAIKQKDYLAGALKFVSEIAASPAATFASQIAPIVGAVKQVVQVADTVNANLKELADADKLKSMGSITRTYGGPSPVVPGLYAFTDSRAEDRNIRYDGETRRLMTSSGPMKSAYAVLEFRREDTRPDWMLLPDINAAWTRIREAVVKSGNVADELAAFTRTARVSPDLTQADAKRLAAAAERKFAGILAGAESGEILDISDPGSLEAGLKGFLEPVAATSAGEENAILTPNISGAAGMAGSGLSVFTDMLEMVLDHEKGFVDHPRDPGGATNRGVTQRTYDAFRDRKKLKRQSVKELTDAEINEIYWHGFWLPAKCDVMPNDALAMVVFDTAVNHGVKPALKMLQQASGVPAAQCDGAWGDATRQKVMAASLKPGEQVDAFLLERENFYRRLVELKPGQAVFLRGWLNRLASLRAHVGPVLDRMGANGGAESALMTDSGERAPIVAATPDFTTWNPDVRQG